MSQHSALTPERWSRFTLDQQILMIGNELHRGSKLLDPSESARLRSAYERVLALTDLTIQTNSKRTLRRELLRWRDLVGRLYVADHRPAADHAAALRALLRFTPEASRQIPYLEGRGALS
jgi:hypothetical protein